MCSSIRLMACIAALSLGSFAQGQQRIEGLFTPIGAKDASGLTRLAVAAPAVAELRASTGSITLGGVPLATGVADITLTPFSPFAADARIILITRDLDALLPRPDATYFRGHADGAAVFLRISPSGDIFAMTAGGEAPATVLKTRGAAGFTRLANTGAEEHFCPGGLAPPDAIAPAPGNENKIALSDYRILVDMENRLLQNVFNGNVAEAIGYVADIYGVVSAVYLRDVGVSITVSDLVLWGSPAVFELPLVNSTSPTYTNLLNAYSGVDNARTGYARHLSHLLAFYLSSYGNTTGLAFTGALCSSSKQGSSTLNGTATAFDPDTNEQDPLTVAHEIGHNFGAIHTASNTLMDAIYVPGLQFAFDPESVTLMQNHINSASCSEILVEQCPPDALLSRAPADTGEAFAFVESDTEQDALAAELFPAPSAAVGRLRWWGTTLDVSNAPCTRSINSFIITTYADDAGVPGAQNSGQTVVASLAETGLSLDGHALLQYDATLVSPIPAGASGWISIEATGDSNCGFLWATSATGNGSHHALAPIAGPAIGDLSYCFLPLIEVAPIEALQCSAGALYSQALELSATPFIAPNRFISNLGADLFSESFSGITQPIISVQWWGWNINGADAACTRAPDEFEIAFRNSPGGGAVHSFTLTPTREVVEVESIPPFIRYTAALPSPVSMTNGNLSIQGVGDAACNFSWATSQEGDDEFFFTSDSGTFFFNNLDGAFCLLGEETVGDGEGEGAADGEGEGEGALEAEGEGAEEGEAEQCPDPLIISEYIEGSSNSKAIEITNLSSGPVSLAPYRIEIYTNGESSASSIALSVMGAIAAGDSILLVHASADDALISVADRITSQVNFNGDDAIALVRDGATIVDLIGQIGVDPGTTWTSGAHKTLDQTLRRKSTVCSGNPAGFASGTTLQSEWDSFPVDTFGDAGAAIFDCALCEEEGEGIAEGEGEGIADGEGIAEGEGIDEGEGITEGEGAPEGEGEGAEGEGEGSVDGEGEGEELSLQERALLVFNAADSNGNNALGLNELLPFIPEFTAAEFIELDLNGDQLLRVFELLPTEAHGLVLSFDFNADFVVSLGELLRVIQLYNAGTYACNNNTQDGFSFTGGQSCCSGEAEVVCRRHDGVADAASQHITLSDLLRAIQLYAYAGYRKCSNESETTFCPDNG